MKTYTIPPHTSKICLIFLSLVFAVCVALGIYFILPKSTVTALADTFSHTYEESHLEGTWTKLTADLVDSNEDGKTEGEIVGSTTDGQATYYYLDEDVTLGDYNITITGNVVLCLNGNVLTGTGNGSVITVEGDATLILCDCKYEIENEDYAHNYYVDDDGKYEFCEEDCNGSSHAGYSHGTTIYGGVITGGVGTENDGVYVNGGGVNVRESANFTMEGGIIAGNKTSTGLYSTAGGVWVDNSATFTMNGGIITGNWGNTNGGGVYVSSGTFTMNGGTITGNSSNADSTWGGESNVLIDSGSAFTMTGGYLESISLQSTDISVTGGYLSESAYSSASGYIAEESYIAVNISSRGTALDEEYEEGYPYAVYTKSTIAYTVSADGVTYGNSITLVIEGNYDYVIYEWTDNGGNVITGGADSLPADVGEYTVTAYILTKDESGISASSCYFTVKIAQAAYEETLKLNKNDEITADCDAQTLGDVGLSAYDDDYGTWSWEESSTTITSGNSYTAVYTPNDTNYAAVEVEVTVVVAEHNLIHVEAKDPTETEPGNEEYWHCSECGKYFSDKACTAETTLDEVTLPATGEGATDEEEPGTGDTDSGTTDTDGEENEGLSGGAITDGEENEGLSGGAIAGIVIACVVVVCAAAGLIVFFIKRKNNG